MKIKSSVAVAFPFLVWLRTYQHRVLFPASNIKDYSSHVNPLWFF